MSRVVGTLDETLALPLGDKLQRLAVLCPSDVVAIELLVDDCLVRRWPHAPRVVTLPRTLLLLLLALADSA